MREGEVEDKEGEVGQVREGEVEDKEGEVGGGGGRDGG